MSLEYANHCIQMQKLELSKYKAALVKAKEEKESGERAISSYFLNAEIDIPIDIVIKELEKKVKIGEKLLDNFIIQKNKFQSLKKYGYD